jgi:TolB protein
MRFPYLGLFLAFIFHANCHSDEIHLKNIQQLTFPVMGFEKAGEAYFSPSAELIAFQAVPLRETNYQIFVMHLDENIPRMVSTGMGACTCAYFHPDGHKMIFASSHGDPNPHRETPEQNGNYKWDLTPYMNIYEANVDGSDLKPLTSGPAYHAECAYSSDGSRIVYASNEDGHMNLYTMNADGSDVRQVTHTSNCYNGGPFFSPDGTKIIFRSDRHIPHFLQIYVIDVDGTNERQITDNDAVNWAPYWHPNGKVIAYTTSIHGHYLYQIYLLNLETGAEARLTYGKCFDGLPVFSPDGEKLLWTSKRGPDNTCQIFIADFIMPSNL